MSLEIGQVFAGYTIRRVLGSGGMGTVYLASHPRLPREDALKVLPADLTDNPEFRARFTREADLAASLSHPHIVRVHDRGEADGQFWISMDYVRGTDAGALSRTQYPRGMPLDQVVAIVTAVGSALDYAHNRGLLHRDVKPANILLTEPDGQPRRVFLADFGIARRIDDASRLTSTNMTVGTAAYAAPEQLKGEPIDGRADQYSLACTAFHLLAGIPPYDHANPMVVISHHVNSPPPPISAYRPELAELDSVFATAMAKKPDDRFASCQDFANQLGQRLSAAAYTQETQPATGHRRRLRDRQAHRETQTGRATHDRRRAHHHRGSQQRAVHRRLPGQLRGGHPHQRPPGSGCASHRGQLRRPLGVRSQRVRRDRSTPRR
jgi:serine/threonine protein kinase